MDQHTDNKGFLLDNDEISDLLEIRHWWKNRRDNNYSDDFTMRKPRSYSLQMDPRSSSLPPIEIDMGYGRPMGSQRPPRSPNGRRRRTRNRSRHRSGHGSKVGGVRQMIDRAVRRSSSIDPGDFPSMRAPTSTRRRAKKYRQEWLDHKHQEDSDSESDSQDDLMGKFQKSKHVVPKYLNPNEKRGWEKMTVEQQIERLKNSARREALIAQAKLWEAQEKQKLLDQLSESENKVLVREALDKLRKGSKDPVFKRLTNCIMDEDTPPGKSGSNGRTRRNSDGDIFE